MMMMKKNNVLEVIMGGPAEKVRVWVPKYGPMGGFGQKISGPNFFGTGLGLVFGPRVGPKGAKLVQLVTYFDNFIC